LVLALQPVVLIAIGTISDRACSHSVHLLATILLCSLSTEEIDKRVYALLVHYFSLLRGHVIQVGSDFRDILLGCLFSHLRSKLVDSFIVFFARFPRW
jgi:hypothetical protein